MTADLRVEPDGQSSGHCDCCGERNQDDLGLRLRWRQAVAAIFYSGRAIPRAISRIWIFWSVLGATTRRTIGASWRGSITPSRTPLWRSMEAHGPLPSRRCARSRKRERKSSPISN